MSTTTERQIKRERLLGLMADKGLDALWLRRVSSFAWYTGGAASYVNIAAEYGPSSLLITAQQEYVIANNIEATRLRQEERLEDAGFAIEEAPWHETNPWVKRLTAGQQVGTDGPLPGMVDVAGEVARLRAWLTPAEGERLRALGTLCAAAMDAAIRQVRPGMSEYEIAARLAEETLAREAFPIVNLIATDERIYRFRHPLPTAKRLDRYAMLVLCGRRGGLICSITRLVYFGSLPDDLRRRHAAVAQVDAVLHAYTRPGVTLGAVLAQAQASYAATGYADEWQLHHQGGATGYESREYLGLPGSSDVVRTGQAFAWNPSITGTKSEDTILVGQEGYEVLTETPGWPMVEVAVQGRLCHRPAILAMA
jgi:antitoxin VapB